MKEQKFVGLLEEQLERVSGGEEWAVNRWDVLGNGMSILEYRRRMQANLISAGTYRFLP